MLFYKSVSVTAFFPFVSVQVIHNGLHTIPYDGMFG